MLYFTLSFKDLLTGSQFYGELYHGRDVIGGGEKEFGRLMSASWKGKALALTQDFAACQMPNMDSISIHSQGQIELECVPIAFFNFTCF